MSCIPYSLISHTTTTPSLHCGFQTQNKCSKRRVLDEKNWAKFHRWLSWIIISLSCRYSWHCGHYLVCKSILSTYPMPFILGGFPHSTMSFSNLYSWRGVSSQYVLFKYPQWVLSHWVSYSRHPMPLSDTGVQAICLSRQSDPLNSLPHSAFWLPGTIYAGVLPHSMFLSMKDSLWSSIMSNNLPQSAAWLFPDTLDIPMPFILVGLPPTTFFSNIHSGSFLTGFCTLDVTILLTPNHDCFFFTHHSDPIAPDSSHMTYLLRSQSAWLQSFPLQTISLMITHLDSLPMTPYLRSTWSVCQTH